VEDPAARRGEQQEERSQQLREQPPPLQPGIVEISAIAELQRQEVMRTRHHCLRRALRPGAEARSDRLIGHDHDPLFDAERPLRVEAVSSAPGAAASLQRDERLRAVES
jgi:hypothetical protein